MCFYQNAEQWKAGMTFWRSRCCSLKAAQKCQGRASAFSTTWGSTNVRAGRPVCVHKPSSSLPFVLLGEQIQRSKPERNFKWEILENSEIAPPNQKNPGILSMPLLAMHCNRMLCVQMAQNRGNFYYFQPKMNICITTVPERISWDAASCFQWRPEMTAKE